MSRRLLGSLRGVGAVHAGDLLLRTTAYDLSLWTDDPAEHGDSASSIDGHIDITGIQEAVVLAVRHADPDNRGRPAHGIPAHEQSPGRFPAAAANLP